MQKIRIDFDNPGMPQHISAVENDSQSRFFQATLYENGKAYTAPEGATYSIMYRGFGPQNQGWYDTINDGAGKRAACAVAGNVVTCEIARQALQVPGHVSIVLCVTTGKGYMLKSWPIECDCKNDHYDSTAEIQSFFYITQVSNADWTQAIQAWENLKDTIDPTLSVSGKAADAKETGDKFNNTLQFNREIMFDADYDFDAEFDSDSITFLSGDKNAKNAPFSNWETTSPWIIENIKINGFSLQYFHNSMGRKYRSAFRVGQDGKKWDPWTITPGAYLVTYNFNAPIDFNDRAIENSITLFNIADQNVQNAPFDDWKDGDTWAYVRAHTDYYDLTFLKNVWNPNARYAYNLNGKWCIKSGSPVFNDFNKAFNADEKITETRVYLFNKANEEAYNLPFDDWKKDGEVWVLENIYTEGYQFQYVKCLQNPYKRQAYRVFGQNWTIYNGNTVVCGDGTDIPDIEQGIAKGEATGATVIVRPGHYDLIKMLNISSSNRRSGIKLYNGVHIIFEAGSYVTAEYDGSDEWYHINFEPFYAVGDFTLEGLVIECKNTRYCVHCEFGGIGTHTCKFTNCNMTYTETDGQTWNSGCIGIGLGRYDYIEISGGTYKNILSTTIVDRTEEESYRPIWIHNGINDGCDSKIFIHNVYLPNLGHIELSSYGVTTINTIAQISNSKFGVDVIENFASPNYSTKNIIAVKFNNTIGN